MNKSKAPVCPGCQRPTALVSGSQLFPRHTDLAEKWFWRCQPCDAHVGCHGRTRRALGEPANAELRRARTILHNDRLDPLWKTAIATGGYTPEDPKARAIIRNTARARVYEWLAWKLGMPREDVQVGQMTLDECRRAWRALAGVDYPTIRAWAKARRAAKEKEPAHG